MRWTRLAAALLAGVALVVAAGACGSIISVPDQGVIVSGCQQPALCYVSTCPCDSASIGQEGVCFVKATACDPSSGICDCPATVSVVVDGGATATATSQCIEEAQACVGRGAFCGGMGASCVPAGHSCAEAATLGRAPMLVPTIGMPALEPHCQLTDDVCCPGAVDGGVATD